jgi:hypothetical protein
MPGTVVHQYSTIKGNHEHWFPSSNSKGREEKKQDYNQGIVEVCIVYRKERYPDFCLVGTHKPEASRPLASKHQQALRDFCVGAWQLTLAHSSVLQFPDENYERAFSPLFLDY